MRTQNDKANFKTKFVGIKSLEDNHLLPTEIEIPEKFSINSVGFPILWAYFHVAKSTHEFRKKIDSQETAELGQFLNFSMSF